MLLATLCKLHLSLFARRFQGLFSLSTISDFVPANFVKDLLVHEAHHHPYLERLAQMYLMITKNPKFGSDAGATWRQLFVLSFMPWMRKYRVFSQERISQAKDDLALRKLEAEEDEIGFGEQFQKDLFDLKDDIFSSAEEANAVRERAQKDAADLTSNLFHSVEKKASNIISKGSGAESSHEFVEF
jgi:vacuolar-type H+-ATPase subunit H